MKKSLLVLALASVFASAAQADDGLATNFSMVTKYKFRGQDQSDPSSAWRPAPQGGFDYTLGAFYAGVWTSAVGFGSGTEVDVYGGVKGDLGSGLGYDVGFLRYQYPGLAAANTNEIYGALTYGPVTAKYSHTVTDEYFGFAETKGTGYLDLTANVELSKGLTGNAHVGFTRFPGAGKAASGVVNYVDWKLGATMDLDKGLTAGAAFVGATKKDVWGDINKTRLVLTVTKTM